MRLDKESVQKPPYASRRISDCLSDHFWGSTPVFVFLRTPACQTSWPTSTSWSVGQRN